MTCDILVKPNGVGFVATVLALPGCVVEASTRDAAIEGIRLKLLEWMNSGEIVRIDLGDPPQAKARGAGIFSNESEESWNQFLEAMREYRRELNADPNQP